MMDQFIITSTLVSLFVFLFLHFLILPKIPQKEIFKGLIIVYLLSGFTPFLLGLAVSLYHLLPGYFLSSIIWAAIISLIFYTFLVLAYIMTVLGIMESSVRMRLLSEIYSHPRGIRINEILKKYNKDVILKKRLDRFAASGEISLKAGFYQKERKFTPYTLPDLIIRLVWKLYGGADV